MIFDDWTLDELKGFRKALAKAAVSGQLMVRFADRQVQYQSTEAMLRAAALLDGAITGRAGTRVRQYRVDSARGYD